jgi:hypothetical protein
MQHQTSLSDEGAKPLAFKLIVEPIVFRVGWHLHRTAFGAVQV